MFFIGVNSDTICRLTLKSRHTRLLNSVVSVYIFTLCGTLYITGVDNVLPATLIEFKRNIRLQSYNIIYFPQAFSEKFFSPA